MSALESVLLPGRKSGPKLELVMIRVSSMEDSLFCRFLSRGSAFTANPAIRNVIQQFGYYCVLWSNWCEFEKSFIFASMSYKMESQAPNQNTTLPGYEGSPLFRIQLVGNRILLPNEFWDEERQWLLQNKQPVDIAKMVLDWLHSWKINAEVESSTPIQKLSEIDIEARKLRVPMNIKKADQTNEAYPSLK